MPWFRVYTEAVKDTKLRELPPAQRWVWIAVLTAARESPIAGWLLVSIRRPLTEAALADLAAVAIKDVRAALSAFEANDMIEWDAAIGAWQVCNWQRRQFESDDSTERSRKRRSEATTLQRANNGACNDANPSDATCSETETDIRSSSSDSQGLSTACGQVPAETWDAYAELKLRRTADVGNPVAWKRTVAAEAQRTHGTLASAWYAEFDISPRRLAECLMDGTIRNVQRRTTP